MFACRRKSPQWVRDRIVVEERVARVSVMKSYIADDHELVDVFQRT
jgi:hypothetical protein